MARKKRSARTEYDVGYGKPPKETQFKKGESGNPRGRPKGSQSVGTLLNDILRRRTTVTENGKTRRIPALEVMLRRLSNDAMRGDPTALKLMLSLHDRYGESAETKVSFDEMLAEDQVIIANYLKPGSEAAASAREASPRKRKTRNAK